MKNLVEHLKLSSLSTLPTLASPRSLFVQIGAPALPLWTCGFLPTTAGREGRNQSGIRRSLRMLIHSVLIAGALCTALVPTAHAQTYTYQGYPFTQFTAGAACPPDCSVSGYFTVAGPLPPNVNACLVPVTPLQFSFTDGSVTIDNHSGDFYCNALFADSSGNIFYWYFQVHNPSNDCEIGTSVFGDDSIGCDPANPNGIASNNNTGTWTVSGSPLCKVTVPSPETQFQSPWGPMIYDRSDLGLKPFFYIREKDAQLPTYQWRLRLITSRRI